jgi:hypothetical protein
MIKKGRGKPRTFSNEKELIDMLNEYVRLCKEEWKCLPNISGFCVFCDIHRDTFYQQKSYYSDTYKKAQDILENAVINSRHASDTMKIFYLKNKFRYQDRTKEEVEPIEINVTWV